MGCTKTEKYALSGKRVIFFLRVGGSTLVVLTRRNTLDIKGNDIHCYLFIFHIKSWDQERWWPSREIDANATMGWVIDHASHGYRAAALKLDQQHAAETTVSCSAKLEPSPHKPQARDSITCDKVCNAYYLPVDWLCPTRITL